MTVIDPHLQWMYDDATPEQRAVTQVPVTFDWHGDINTLTAFGMRLHATAGGIISAEMPLSRLPELHDLGIEYIELARPLYAPFLDVSRRDIKADLLLPVIGSETGKGVIVGIVDSGIDYTHASFRKADGTTRILHIWDQRLDPVPPRPGRPPRFPMESDPGKNADGTARRGVAYTEKAINDALKNPKRPLRTKDTQDAHGTHVMGIAAGNGAAKPGGAATGFVGVAPAADLIVVVPKIDEAQRLGPVREGIDFILEKAKLKSAACVINLSLGKALGARDGKSFDERAIDALLDEEGRAIVIAAGNDANKNRHVQSRIAAGAKETFKFRIDAKQIHDRVEVEIWYGLKSTAERFDLTLTDPSGASMSLAATGRSARGSLGRSSVDLASTLAIPKHDKNQIKIDIRRNSRTGRVAPGDWSITLSGATVGTGPDAGTYHGYLRAPGLKKIPPTIFTSLTKATSTVCVPSTATMAISVGSYSTKPNADLHKPVPSSSLGPTLDGRAVPTIHAPGQWITSAKAITSPPDVDHDEKGKPFTAKKGTSMAAPHVAGVAAGMLQVKPKLKQKQIAKLISDTADSGRVNALNAVTAAKNLP